MICCENYIIWGGKIQYVIQKYFLRKKTKYFMQKVLFKKEECDT